MLQLHRTAVREGRHAAGGGEAPKVPEVSTFLDAHLFSKARKGEAIYMDQLPQAQPIRPPWTNMPMMAMVAKRPSACSAQLLRLFC